MRRSHKANTCSAGIKSDSVLVTENTAVRATEKSISVSARKIESVEMKEIECRIKESCTQCRSLVQPL